MTTDPEHLVLAFEYWRKKTGDAWLLKPGDN